MKYRSFGSMIAIAFLVGSSAQSHAQEARSRTFLFTYSVTIKDTPAGKTADVWLPVAVAGTEQDVRIVAKKLPGQDMISRDPTYGNSILYVQAKARDKEPISLEVTYQVTRREVKTDLAANLYLKPAAGEKISRFLQPDVMVPVGGKPLELIEGKKLPDDQFAAAKVLYDVVNTHMVYKKEGAEWGRGDAVWACDSKFGNCSDFHSLFISLARAKRIPSKFEMGFPVPQKRGEGVIGGYHCWAWFLPNGKGWVPVDISEASRNPEMRQYYFGNLTEDRVHFTTGRDIDLVPKQQGPALNFFIYPYVEVDGRPHAAEKVTRTFAFKDL